MRDITVAITVHCIHPTLHTLQALLQKCSGFNHPLVPLYNAIAFAPCVSWTTPPGEVRTSRATPGLGRTIRKCCVLSVPFPLVLKSRSAGVGNAWRVFAHLRGAREHRPNCWNTTGLS
jgi:hypothetical protein